jgi:hypothetical protein
MSVELKIKAKHLALEPAIIRKEEKKLWDKFRRSGHENVWDCKYGLKATLLESHRKVEVRREARATHLARAFIKGLPYEAVESNKPLSEPSFDRSYFIGRMTKMIKKYHPERHSMSLDEWTKKITEWLS